jgi:hypothetical protein
MIKKINDDITLDEILDYISEHLNDDSFKQRIPPLADYVINEIREKRLKIRSDKIKNILNEDNK